MNLLELLANKKIIEKDQIPIFQKEMKESGGNIENILNTHGVSEDEILNAKSEYYGVPIKKLEGPIPLEILKYIPEKSANYYKILPLSIEEGVLEVGFVDPDNMEARDAVSFISSKNKIPFKIFLISEKDIDKIRKSYGGLSGEVNKALDDLETELSTEEKKVSKEIKKVSSGKEMKTRIIEDAPVTKIVATILRYATEGRASDIHIEPMDDIVRVRFRVDGVMHTSLKLPNKVLSAVVARIKILSNMKLDEKRKPQDGRFSAHVDNRKIDFRVSTFPTYYGEKVVMRILDPEKGVIPIDKMGISKKNLKAIKDAIKRPYGLILISGPTGSGKTTTLYSMLEELDRESKNILSLENPIEYNIPGINQSEIRPEIGYTFANGLRTTLRQDPDIIMVGEIRDKETAQLAVQAALTGHLVFSTIHTNNTVGVIPRLVEMGIDPYLIAPTLVIAIAQRLVKVRCPNSGKEVEVEGSMRIMFEKQFEDLAEEYKKDIKISDKVYNISPSPECPNGTKGRTAVFEVLEMNKNIEEIILKNPVETEVYKVARKNGMLTLREDALIKAFEGIIPIEEANKL